MSTKWRLGGLTGAFIQSVISVIHI